MNTRWLPLIFLVCALPSGLCLALLTPMGQVADEPEHITRAAGLLEGQLVGQRFMFRSPISHREFLLSGVRVNAGLAEASLAKLPPYIPGPSFPRPPLKPPPSITWSPLTILDGASNTVQYFPILYLPGTLGIALAHAAGGSPMQALYTGRVFMLASYIALGAAAIMLAAFGRGLLFTLLLLPMALSLGASFNQDGQLIAMTALAGAFLTLDPSLYPRRRLAALPLIALVLLSKPPYGLLLFAALTPLAAPRVLWRFLKTALFALPVLIWVALMVRVSLVPYHRPAYYPGPLWPGSHAIIFHATSAPDNLKVLIARPIRFLIMPVQYVWVFRTDMVKQVIGVLGWLAIWLPIPYYFAWLTAIAAAAAGAMAAPARQGVRWTLLDAGFILALVILSIFAVELAIYLSWDNVGRAIIKGPQGRYFLLFVPFLILVLPRLGDRLNRAARRPDAARYAETMLTLPAIAMAVADIGYLPWLIVHRFYLR